MNKNVGFTLEESFADKQRCCGCDACSHVCPKKCIILKEDSEGFLYPTIDSARCINCGICTRVCPVLNAKDKSEGVFNCYVGYLKNNCIRLKSSSGGLFYPLAKSILDQGGVVFGAAFDDQWNAHHISVEKTRDLPLLMGSKYIQSRTENTFVDCKKILDQGRPVLYSGVACQIAGLKSFLKKDYEKLITIDVLCHGTPSPKVWQRYLEWRKKEYKSTINNIEFRNKNFGWSIYSLKIHFKNNKNYSKKYTNDYYYSYFLSNVGLRPSCHDCKFKSLERPSDITIGDAWGINNHHPELNDEKGTSVILVHSERGKIFLSQQSSFLNLVPVDVNIALPATADSRKSVCPYKTRTQFFNKLNTECSYPELLPFLPKKPNPIKRTWQKIKRFAKKVT